MKLLLFYGRRNNAFVCKGQDISIEQATSGSASVLMRVGYNFDALIVRGQYDEIAETWWVGVAPYPEQHLPDWPIKIELNEQKDSQHAPVLVIEAPDGVGVMVVPERV